MSSFGEWMSRGLGKLQREILRVLKITLEENSKEWYDIRSLAYMVFDPVHHEKCFNFNYNDYHPNKPSNSQFQSFWRAIRDLERREHLVSRKVVRTLYHRTGFSKRGGISHEKEVKLNI